MLISCCGRDRLIHIVIHRLLIFFVPISTQKTNIQKDNRDYWESIAGIFPRAQLCFTHHLISTCWSMLASLLRSVTAVKHFHPRINMKEEDVLSSISLRLALILLSLPPFVTLSDLLKDGDGILVMINAFNCYTL